MLDIQRWQVLSALDKITLQVQRSIQTKACSVPRHGAELPTVSLPEGYHWSLGGGCDREAGIPCHRLQLEMPSLLTSRVFGEDPECQKPLVQNAGQGQECPIERQGRDMEQGLKVPGKR